MPNTDDFKQHKKRQRQRRGERRQVALDELLDKFPPTTTNIADMFQPIPPLLHAEAFWSRVPALCNPTTAVLEEETLANLDLKKLEQNQRNQEKIKWKLAARQERGEITNEQQVQLWSQVERTVNQSKDMSVLSAHRGQRKAWQVENFVQLLGEVLEPGMTVIDFGSGSGNLCLALAAYFTKVRFVLVDRNLYSLQLVAKRAEASGIHNVQIQQYRFTPDNLSDYRPPPPPPPPTTTSTNQGDTNHQNKRAFDLGIGLHCCGSFTDMVMEVCRQEQADCIVCPCCNGGITSKAIKYPRSTLLQTCLTADEYLGQLSRSADNQNNYTAKCWIEYDRALWAQDQGLQVELWKLTPMDCTPKHHVLYVKQPLKTMDLVESSSSGM